MARNDGGPAFPDRTWTHCGPSGDTETTEHPGMSLRDYFATVAMGELGGYYTAARPANKTSQKHARQIAMHAYCLADAMLAERAEAPEGETPA